MKPNKARGTQFSGKFSQNLSALNYHLEKTKLLFFKKKKPKEIDKWLFSCEDLPKFGKEYWFIHLASSKKNSFDQLILTFGRSEGKIKVSGFPIDSRLQKSDYACLIWAYQNKKISLLNSASSLSFEDNGLLIENGATKLKISGSYPDYRLQLKNGKKIIANLRLSNSKSNNKKYEFLEMSKGIFGIDQVNLHMDFTGALNSKKIYGKALVQKVIVVGPFMPWKWGRIVFNDGSVLSFFKLHLGNKKIRYVLNSSAYFCDGKTGETTRIKDIIIKDVPGSSQWIIQSRNKKLKLLVETYSSESVKLKSKGSFEYKEYLVKALAFKLENKSKNIDLDMLGGGIGLLENANGHLL